MLLNTEKMTLDNPLVIHYFKIDIEIKNYNNIEIKCYFKIVYEKTNQIMLFVVVTQGH